MESPRRVGTLAQHKASHHTVVYQSFFFISPAVFQNHSFSAIVEKMMLARNDFLVLRSLGLAEHPTWIKLLATLEARGLKPRANRDGSYRMARSNTYKADLPSLFEVFKFVEDQLKSRDKIWKQFDDAQSEAPLLVLADASDNDKSEFVVKKLAYQHFREYASEGDLFAMPICDMKAIKLEDAFKPLVRASGLGVLEEGDGGLTDLLSKQVHGGSL